MIDLDQISKVDVPNFEITENIDNTYLYILIPFTIIGVASIFIYLYKTNKNENK